jgi:hypothetical protein
MPYWEEIFMNSNVPQGSSRPQGHFGLLTRAAPLKQLREGTKRPQT